MKLSHAIAVPRPVEGGYKYICAETHNELDKKSVQERTRQFFEDIKLLGTGK